MLDLNDAPEQYTPEDRALSWEERTASVRECLLAAPTVALHHLFPAGVLDRNGKHFLIGDVAGNEGDSLTVCLQENRIGLWKDWAGDHDDHGDLIKLWQKSRGVNFKDAILEMEDFYSIPRPVPQLRTHSRESSKSSGNGKADGYGKVTGSWFYRDADGRVVCKVERVEPPNGKKYFRPWSVKEGDYKFPEPRLLYNLPGIKDAETVYLVEGEKCADALIDKGYCATTAIGGSKTALDKLDLFPLAGKNVVIWPDKDKPGWQYLEAITPRLKAISRSVSWLLPPDEKPEKWDAADAVADGTDLKAFIATASSPFPTKAGTVKPFNSLDYTADKCGKYPPSREWLVRAVFPMGAVSILAATGDTGKGMLTLDLACKVAFPHQPDPLEPYPRAFGNDVVASGTVLMLAGEDTWDEFHRRLAKLDSNEDRLEYGKRLRFVAFPNVNRSCALIVPGREGPITTTLFEEIKRDIASIEDLKLIVIDPLSSFIMTQINQDPISASHAMAELATLAAQTGAAVIACHHMAKPKGTITGPASARDAIRGTSAIVDGARAAYCLWPPKEDRAREICRTMSWQYDQSKIYLGAVVKSNGPVDRMVRVWGRAPEKNGLLVDISPIIYDAKTSDDEAKNQLIDDIKRAAEAGRPFTKTGQSGVYSRREELRESLRKVSKNRLDRLLNELLTDKLIFKCKDNSKSSKEVKWLDIKGGPFWDGTGEFSIGYQGDE